jgi:Putative auto-transporter adhesin, head GIN domain
MTLQTKHHLTFTAAAALALGLLAASSPAHADESLRLLEIDQFVGRIEMRTMPGAALTVRIAPGRKQTATQSVDGTTLRVQGGFERRRTTSCNVRNGKTILRINGETFEAGDLPTLFISGPDDLGLRIKNSEVAGTVGNLGGATISMPGCGNLTIGKVGRSLELTLAGSGDFRAGAVGADLTVNLAGSGNVATGPVGGAAAVNLVGSGDVKLTSASRVLANIAGSGDVRVENGRGALDANIAGSGNVFYGGVAISPKVSIMGSGDVMVKAIDGEPSVSRMGSGRLRTGGQQ